MHGLSGLTATIGALLVMWGLPAAIITAAAMPFLAFSAVRNLRKTRVALERIADALESSPRTSGAGVLKL
jgi:hypothetical protein